MLQVKRWLYNLLYDPYSTTANAILAIGFSVGLAILGLSLFFAGLDLNSQPAPAPAPAPSTYQPVPTVTVIATPTPKSKCLTYDQASRYYDVHQGSNLCVIR
jgi:hypothetical protein